MLQRSIESEGVYTGPNLAIARERVRLDGKHLIAGGLPFRVRGVTYGSFTPRLDGEPYPDPSVVKQDFRDMESLGINTVRTYAVPPEDVLDAAGEMGIRLIVGVHYEDWRYEIKPGRAAHNRVIDRGRAAIAEAMERCGGRPEVLAISVGNEVPVDVARVHGIPRIEKALSSFVHQVHAADPEMLATYCNFPTTEFFRVEDQDIICFNVFLEDPNAFRRYLRHLQVVSDEKPLVITELGLAAGIHGESEQARCLEWQLRAVSEAGCAGATVFSWTDDWSVAGEKVGSWGFGITDEERIPKPSVEAVAEWARSHPADLRESWPRVSVVVCAYNAASHIEGCLRSLLETHYPNLEVIVCDDGSSDETLALARRFPFTTLELGRGGLSNARNAGIRASSGDIVAFLDSDARCHPEWPYHLVLSLEDEVAATGGPNLPPEDVGFVERAVASSPGGPMHVLTADDRAEHVPGCNMAYRKDILIGVGGFDPMHTAAGDDVDVCWKLLDRGYEIGFSAAAQVMHHRRDTVKGYLKQQRGYGKAEKMLQGPHRHRFNRLGQARWRGFIYGGPRFLPMLLRPIVYHGYFGSAPYQGVVKRRSEIVRDHVGALLPLAVPLFLLGVALAPFSMWWTLLSALALLWALGYGSAIAAGASPPRDEQHPLRFRALIGFLHVAQPIVRTWGRMRTRKTSADVGPSGKHQAWAGDRDRWLTELQRGLLGPHSTVRIGEPSQNWDLEAVGFLAIGRVTTAVAWRWSPMARVDLRPRIRTLIALSCCIPLSLLNPIVGAGLAAGVILGLAVETAVLSRRVWFALASTTAGANRE